MQNVVVKNNSYNLYMTNGVFGILIKALWIEFKANFYHILRNNFDLPYLLGYGHCFPKLFVDLEI